jgi:hypothetical protein
MLQDLLPDPHAEESSQPASCRFGVLDYKVYSETVIPLLERARKSSTSRPAMAELRAFLTGLRDKNRREEALAQFDRLDAAVQGSRWHRGAAGAIIEAATVDDAARLRDLSNVLRGCLDYIYAWNPEHGETIHRFWAHLGDTTLAWASPPDTWRGIIEPPQLAHFANAAHALSPRDLKRILTDAERGEIFSDAEAEELSEWWGEVRKVARMALRLEQGMLVAVRHAI